MFGAYRGVSFDENASLGILQHLDKDELQRLMDDDSKLQDLITDLQQVLEINVVCTNPLHATFFWENVKIHLHLLSFLNTEMAQVGYIFLRKCRGLRKSKTCSSKTVNPMAADDSETQGAKALCYYSDGTLSQSFQPMAVQSLMKAAPPLAKSLVTASYRSCNRGPWASIEMTLTSFLGIFQGSSPRGQWFKQLIVILYDPINIKI